MGLAGLGAPAGFDLAQVRKRSVQFVLEMSNAQQTTDAREKLNPVDGLGDEVICSALHAALDIAKFLIDNGIHPPTVYFPLSVKEAMMIEPTETESKQTLDRFADIMIAAAKMAESDPEGFHDMPVSMPVYRLDEVKAARELDCNYKG